MEAPRQSSLHKFTQKVSSVFPDISFGSLQSLAHSFNHNTEAAINHVMDEQERGRPYRKAKMKPPVVCLKRKREQDSADVDQDPSPVDKAARTVPKSSAETLAICKLLHQEYPCVPRDELPKLLRKHRYCLRSAYLALDKIVRTWDTLHKKPWKMTSDPRTIKKPYLSDRNHQNLRAAIDSAESGHKKSVLEELSECWKLRAQRDGKRQDASAEKKAREDAKGKVKGKGKAKEDTRGVHLVECQCCFLEHPFEEMVGCQGDVIHFFCKDCARRSAETLIGLSKYELTCMSMDKCNSGFSQAERARFLDEKLIKALDRIEATAVLLMANLEGLVRCPFCTYAAECPPAEEQREFQCANPECKVVSCRFCLKETHIPMSCAEYAKECGHSARREIEEAMSAAMIRKCNKCQTPFVREAGCNKMTCSQAACRNVQCYVCSKSCDYSHFNDPSKGGKKGNCPLFDSAEARHENEVKKAEATARKAIEEQQPDVDPGLLKFDMSNSVLQDDERRKLRDMRYEPAVDVEAWQRYHEALRNGIGRLHGHQIQRQPAAAPPAAPAHPNPPLVHHVPHLPALVYMPPPVPGHPAYRPQEFGVLGAHQQALVPAPVIAAYHGQPVPQVPPPAPQVPPAHLVPQAPPVQLAQPAAANVANGQFYPWAALGEGVGAALMPQQYRDDIMNILPLKRAAENVRPAPDARACAHRHLQQQAGPALQNQLAENNARGGGQASAHHHH